MVLRRLARWSPVLLALGLAACGSVPRTTVESYRCAGGKEFSLVRGPEGARVELAGMRFPVYPEAGREGVYACEVLTVWRDGRSAWMDMEGRPALRECTR